MTFKNRFVNLFFASEQVHGTGRKKPGAVGLASNSKLLCIELVSLGTLIQSIVELTDIFVWALHKQISMLVLVLNHPSGELMPTTADLGLTDQMIQFGRIVHIPMKDHLIITTEGYYSFERMGDLKRLKKSKKYVPGYVHVEEIKKAAEKIGEERGEKRGIEKGAKGKAFDVAKAMKEEGEPLEKISKFMGLS